MSNAIAGYTKIDDRGRITLTNWKGAQLIDRGAHVIQEFRTGEMILAWRVGAARYHRWIIGYALDANGMLFRGELITEDDFDEVRRAARAEASYWIERDAEDEANFEAQQEAERLAELEAEFTELD